MFDRGGRLGRVASGFGVKGLQVHSASGLIEKVVIVYWALRNKLKFLEGIK
jgi:hypothetical protein